MWVVYVLAILVAIAGISAGTALTLHLVAPSWSMRKRTVISAAIAAFLPMSVLFGGFLYESGETLAEDGSQGFVLGFVSLFVLQLLIWSIVSLPPAWLTSKRLAKADDVPVLPAPDEPQLIEG